MFLSFFIIESRANCVVFDVGVLGVFVSFPCDCDCADYCY